MRQVKLYLVMVRYLPMLRMAMATLEPVVHTSQHFLYRYTYHIGVFFSYLPLLRMAMATLNPSPTPPSTFSTGIGVFSK